MSIPSQDELFSMIEKELGKANKVNLSTILAKHVENAGCGFKLEALCKGWVILVNRQTSTVTVYNRNENTSETPIQTQKVQPVVETTTVRYSTAKKVKDFKACQKLADEIMKTLPEHQQVKDGLPSERLYKMFKAMKEF